MIITNNKLLANLTNILIQSLMEENLPINSAITQCVEHCHFIPTEHGVRVAVLNKDFFSEEEIEYFSKCGETELEMLLEDDGGKTCRSYTIYHYANIVNSTPNAFNNHFIRIYGE